jgi:hypothetical protein
MNNKGNPYHDKIGRFTTGSSESTNVKNLLAHHVSQGYEHTMVMPDKPGKYTAIVPHEVGDINTNTNKTVYHPIKFEVNDHGRGPTVGMTYPADMSEVADVHGMKVHMMHTPDPNEVEKYLRANSANAAAKKMNDAIRKKAKAK